MKTEFFAHGKLLLSGEYAVLDGALALALPTRPGQHLRAETGSGAELHWTSLEADGSIWLEARFGPGELDAPLESRRFPAAPKQRLLYLLQAAVRLHPGFRDRISGTRVETRLDFPKNWGLGTSSTLVANLAAWSGADPYELLALTFGGSGYDLACARAGGPIFYQKRNNGQPLVEPVDFRPPFTDSLHLIYLNEKQDSREGIRRYLSLGKPSPAALEEVSDLSRALAAAADLPTFREILERHEALVSSWLGMPPVKHRLFPDYPGSIKSLGAWGGDFVLAAGQPGDAAYFREKGYATCLSLRELVLP
ncbi:GYDIA family GHMP kinase [Robiginitalea sp. SC105]|uniref:GYDIA family GHMP kinase n=1 Tax=Robiginitalea sp. SC105 TaxID=2762332 RepID=UPI00163A4A7B|nr:GYDIA family GHMP kinase [Robiginitalea sp. SC105]MBC2837801.1 GHMP kinase [Robiginitalea sp. SC105]